MAPGADLYIFSYKQYNYSIYFGHYNVRPRRATISAGKINELYYRHICEKIAPYMIYICYSYWCKSGSNFRLANCKAVEGCDVRQCHPLYKSFLNAEFWFTSHQNWCTRKTTHILQGTREAYVGKQTVVIFTQLVNSIIKLNECEQQTNF